MADVPATAVAPPADTPAAPVRRDLVVTLLALAAVLAWDFLGQDLAVMRRFGNAQGFAWHDAWLASKVLHDGGRIFGWSVLAVQILDAIRPLLPGPTRRQRWKWIGVQLACLVLVPGLKRISATSCPWDLAEFGGTASFVSHWQFGVLDGGPGHCFPSGHAVAAFAFFGLYFCWRDSRPVLARWMLAGVFAAGVLFGGAQLVRGAHYPSHTLWTAWLCWLICVLAAHPVSARLWAGVARQRTVG